MNYEEWEAGVPEVFRNDPVWKMRAYRLALFAGDLAWPDCGSLQKDRRTEGLVSQLYRSAGAISSDIAEGYSRATGRERARFLEYALGSAREAREWYYKSRFVLSESVFTHRTSVLSEIISLLVTMIRRERKSNRRLSED